MKDLVDLFFRSLLLCQRVWKRDILGGGESGNQVVGLEDEADIATPNNGGSDLESLLSG